VVYIHCTHLAILLLLPLCNSHFITYVQYIDYIITFFHFYFLEMLEITFGKLADFVKIHSKQYYAFENHSANMV